MSYYRLYTLTPTLQRPEDAYFPIITRAVIASICITPLHDPNMHRLHSIPFHYRNCPTDIDGGGVVNELKWTKLTQINR